MQCMQISKRLTVDIHRSSVNNGLYYRHNLLLVLICYRCSAVTGAYGAPVTI